MKITICGSAKFEPVWHEANKQLGLAGHICYSLMTFPSIEKEKTWYTPEQKQSLDLAHLAKIEESDAVVMLNVNGYLGESSTRELEWARLRNKQVFWLELSSMSRPLESTLDNLLPSKLLFAIRSKIPSSIYDEERFQSEPAIQNPLCLKHQDGCPQREKCQALKTCLDSRIAVPASHRQVPRFNIND